MVKSELYGWLLAQTWPDVMPGVGDAAPTAFRHPYGFIVVRLPIDRYPGWGIRVHLWPSGQRAQAMSGRQYIHRHGWELLTRTLVGAVRHDEYDISSPEASGLVSRDHWSAYTVESDAGVGESTMRSSEKLVDARLVHSSIADSSSGVTQVQASRFHSTTAEPRHAWSATVVATADRGDNKSSVLVPSDSPAVIVNRREPATDLGEAVEQLGRLYRTEVGSIDRWVSSVFLMRNSQALVVRTFRFPQFWQPIGGQAGRDDSNPSDTAVREVLEETGLAIEAAELEGLGSARRDRGEGFVHAFAARVPADWSPTILETEILEHRWMTANEIAASECFDATRHFSVALTPRN